jgi:pimeloyl-ACP methyl ester carboxylesterase
VAAEPVPTTHNDVRDLTALAGRHAEETVLAVTQGLHRAIAGRVFRYVPASSPVRGIHDAISSLVYGGVRVGLRAATVAGTAVAGAIAGSREVRWLDATPGRSRFASTLHGIVGDRFADDHPALDLPVSVRVGGRAVAPTAQTLAAGVPDPQPRVALFLHGLIMSDDCWDGEDAVLPDVVEELGWTPVRLRYGTGRAIGTNGAELDLLLEELLDAWPVPISELSLIGHSMGGLVIRSAAACAVQHERRWPGLVRHTVSLGTPHLGSWLERVANDGTRLLRRLPEGEVVADVIDRRARGIKDLRHGALTDACWGEGVLHEDGIGGLDGRRIPPPEAVPPLLDGATHHLVAGRLTRSPDHPVTRLIGDALVTPPSALGVGRRRQLTGGRLERLEVHAGHFGLLRHPEVVAHLRRWLR